MKESLRYIIKARFGILFTAVTGAVTMLLTAGIFALPLMNMYRYAAGEPETTKFEAADILSVNFERSSTEKFEIVSLIAAAICAALLAKTALILTAEDLLMRICLVRNTIFINSSSLKSMIFGRGAYDIFADRPSFISELAGASVYFAAAIFFMYAAIIFVSCSRADTI